MDNNNFIFTDNEYLKLKNEYQKLLTATPASNLSILNNTIHSLENNSFQMPLTLQNKILNNLHQSRQILNILFDNTTTNNTTNNTSTNPNPFNLIYNLSTLSNILTAHTFKSTFQILYLKSNNLIVKSIQEISNYFMSKNLKIFKFM